MDEKRPTHRLTPSSEDQRFARRTAMVLLAAGIALFLYKAADLLLLAFGAALGGILLATIADWLVRACRLPRWAGLACAALLLFAVIGAIGWLFAAETGRQTDALARQLPQDWVRLQARIGRTEVGRMLLDSARSGAGDGKMAALLLGGSWKIGEVLVNFVIVVIGAVFFAVDPKVYRRGATLLAPPAWRAPVGDSLDDTATALRLWLLTQLISMVAMGVMIAAGLWLSGLESWAALGVLGGLSEFIPYVGPTLAMIPAVVVALAGEGGGSLWGVIATYALVRMVQANIITPLISQRVVHIPPGLYIFSILAMGFAFGTFGMFFSGALSVAVFTLVRSLYLRETLGDPIPPPG